MSETKPNVDTTLGKETAAQRKVEAVISEADIAEMQSRVEDFTLPGTYLFKKRVYKLSAAIAKRLWSAGLLNDGNGRN